MTPAPGTRVVRHVGDTVRFSLATGHAPAPGWHARLRTNLGRGQVLRDEILQAHTHRMPPFGASWHDVPLDWDGTRWSRELALVEPGFYAAKAYLVDPRGYQYWPDGPDVGISVHPDWTRTANTIYCAFPRLFGDTRREIRLLPEPFEAHLRDLEHEGFAVLPRSGTFRDLARQLPHIVDRLGCRILHLLPVHPTPTVFGRYGRMGSPYAALDLTAVDPALVEFDRRTTGIDQFVELTQATHRLGARVLLDIVINHTGWGSRLHEEHPEFFRRETDGRFACPGAWGVVWEDLVELEQTEVALWDLIANALVTWCRRGVDGFRCDAGYKIPTPVWQYITARVTREFPDTVFLLEGLGGSWEATDNLLGPGGMQWAYSELFQNYSSDEIQRYLDYALGQSDRAGTYVHYSETHDNDRLAKRGRAWSLLRNRLCALTSSKGAFGFTCGVEWLAQEKILVHQRTGLGWDAPFNIVDELGGLNRLLTQHPAFFDPARIRRLSAPGAAAVAFVRTDAHDEHPCLILVNPSAEADASLELNLADLPPPAAWASELLGQEPPTHSVRGSTVVFHLAAATAYCLGQPDPDPQAGTRYREDRAILAWAFRRAAALVPAEQIVARTTAPVVAAIRTDSFRWLAKLVASANQLRAAPGTPRPLDLETVAAIEESAPTLPAVVNWRCEDVRRVTLVPPGWWVLIEDPEFYRAHLESPGTEVQEQLDVIRTARGFVAAIAPRPGDGPTEATLVLDRTASSGGQLRARLRFLAGQPPAPTPPRPDSVVLLTNQRGGMARLRVDFGNVRSKYDCALGANLHPTLPVDRHVLVKRVRTWINADGFITALDRHNLLSFVPVPAAEWRFRANAGNGRTVTIMATAEMLPDRNLTRFTFSRDPGGAACPVALTLRVDIEDRNFHAETHRNPGADHHFRSHVRLRHDPQGFAFTPASDRVLHVTTDRGAFHDQPEWSEHVPHPEEALRGQVAEGDAYSPGWFEIPLEPGTTATLTLDAEPTASPQAPLGRKLGVPSEPHPASPGPALSTNPHSDLFLERLREAVRAFVVRRDKGCTVIAGYPWFLDWGRDTLIAARGLLAGGWTREVIEILDTFGRFAERGTLPNSIHGDNAANRDTSDAPLWYVLVLEDAVRAVGEDLLRREIPGTGRTLLDVARSLVDGYLAGTPNGIRVDAESALVWSPSHFTWMDTNHPAGTPREGYPVEIQALWIRALRFLAHSDRDKPQGVRWTALATTAGEAFARLFWRPESGWFSDLLIAAPGTPAATAAPDDALRSNGLFAVTLGLATPSQAQACVRSAQQYLLVPGALRSLAPLPVTTQLEIRAPDGRLLNDPRHPYWGQYTGDEDTRRKPAYHNGTAWVWTLPTFCEALALAWNRSADALHAARSILQSSADLLDAGCVGHLPEILDGDAPHTPRGCDAQAWSATEMLRVGLWLGHD